MPIDIKIGLLIVGLASGAYMFFMLLWSVLKPEKRIWPPRNATLAIKFRVWFLTILIFASAFLLGTLDWNSFNWPSLLRWSIGLPLIVIGNLIVWRGVNKIGIAATSGEATGLVTDGLYSWSRNPQYAADIAILFGWAVLSASLWALPVLVVGLAVLLIAPFAEEPWLEETYEAQYRDYMQSVRRYI